MADVPNVDYESTITLDEVVVKGKKPASSLDFVSKIGDFFSGLFSRNKSVSSVASSNNNVTESNTTTATGMEPISAIVAGIGAAANGVFGWLGQKQTTKQEEIKLESLEKQKDLIAAQGNIEELKIVQAKIETQKQELLNAQKTQTGSNIVKVAIVGGVLLLAGFVVYQVFKTPKAPKAAPVPATPQPLALK